MNFGTLTQFDPLYNLAESNKKSVTLGQVVERVKLSKYAKIHACITICTIDVIFCLNSPNYISIFGTRIKPLMLDVTK